MMFSAGVAENMGQRIHQLKVKKAFLITDPVMLCMGRADEVRRILEAGGISTVIFSEVEPDPPIELIERAGARWVGKNSFLLD
jgi:alcohol dehydrogenase class IV